MLSLRDALRSLPRPVHADLRESPTAYLLELDLPGATPESVEASVAAGRLHVQASREKAVPGEFQYIDEDRELFLDADLPLPPDATGAGATGQLDQGVLRLELPKRDAAPAATIPIEDGAPDE
ncbi:MAG: Hsp20/alpha crystallin family protein [Salinirussus sp.]